MSDEGLELFLLTVGWLLLGLTIVCVISPVLSQATQAGQRVDCPYDRRDCD